MNTCPTCNQRITPRKERLTPGLVKAFLKFAAVAPGLDNKVHARLDTDFTKSEYNNFQKLRYHALVAKYKENGTHVPGYWLLTRRGNQWRKGQITIPGHVFVQNNRVVGYAEEMVSIFTIMGSDLPYFESRESVEFTDVEDLPLLEPVAKSSRRSRSW